MELLPRISRATAHHLLSIYESSGVPPTIQQRRLLCEGLVSFGATGGVRSPNAFNELREASQQFAQDLGFPKPLTEAGKRNFDNGVAVLLGEMASLRTGEGLRDDVWSYITLVEIPHLANWRFSGWKPFRYLGGVRNTVQRLWMRAAVMDRGEESPDRWDLVNSSNESISSQILDRPKLARDLELSRTVAEVWLMLSKEKTSKMDAVTKLATAKVRMTNEVICLSALESDKRTAIVEGIFRSTIALIARQ